VNIKRWQIEIPKESHSLPLSDNKGPGERFGVQRKEGKVGRSEEQKDHFS